MTDEDEVQEWEHPESRGEREPAGNHEKADCCEDRVRFVAEIARGKFGTAISGGPARFRLCAFHAAVLRRTDPGAKLFPLQARVQ